MQSIRIPPTLGHAIAVGRTEAFEAALNTWLDVLPISLHQAAKDSLLHTAVSFAPPRKTFVFRPGTVAIAKLLLERGANANARDEFGNTPAMLTFCVQTVGSEVRTPPQRALLQLLSQHNADFTLENNGHTIRTLPQANSLARFLDDLEDTRQIKKFQKQTIITPASMRTMMG